MKTANLNGEIIRKIKRKEDIEWVRWIDRGIIGLEMVINLPGSFGSKDESQVGYFQDQHMVSSPKTPLFRAVGDLWSRGVLARTEVRVDAFKCAAKTHRWCHFDLEAYKIHPSNAEQKRETRRSAKTSVCSD